MTHQVVGRWYLESEENGLEYLKALKCTPERIEQLAPLMLITGKDGRVEVYTVDDELNAISRKSYIKGKFFREYVYPFDVEVPTWSLNGKMCRITYTRPTASRLELREIGYGYEMNAWLQVTGDRYDAEMKTTTGVAVKLVYRRCEKPDNSL